jgi:hypothetical protein
MQTENLMIQSVLSNWRLTITRLSTLFGGLSPAEFFEEVAPGRNRIVYFLGHLTAVHDSTLEVLGFGTRSHPELDEFFIKKPDRVHETLPDVADLMSFWEESTNGSMTVWSLFLSSNGWADIERCLMKTSSRIQPGVA